MKELFISREFAENLKSRINQPGLIQRYLKHELNMRAENAAERIVQGEDIKASAGKAVMLSLSGFYLENKEHMEAARQTVERLISVEQEWTQCSSVELSAICKILYSSTFLDSHEEWEVLFEKIKHWLNKNVQTVNTIKKKDNPSIQLPFLIWKNTFLASAALFAETEIDVSKYIEKYSNRLLYDLAVKQEKALTDLTLSDWLSVLDGAALLCELSSIRKVEIWNHETENGINLKKIFQKLIPYARNPYLWEGRDPDGRVPQDSYGFQLASLRLGMDDAASVNKNRGASRYLIRNQDPIGPLSLLPGSAVFDQQSIYSSIGYNVRGYSHEK